MTWPFLPTTGAFASWPDPGTSGRVRKESALRRLRILQEDFRLEIIDRILQTHDQPQVRDRIAKFASVAVNPARDITSAVAIAYDSGVRRLLKGASPDAQAAFSELVKESQAATKAPHWNKYAFFLGPTLVVPCIRKGRLSLDLIRPEVCDIRADPEDPMGTPAAAAWSSSGSAAFVLLDDTAWRYLDDRGKDTKDPQEHGYGQFPGAVFRLDEPVDDWWPRNYQERLVDATITTAYTYAKMQWVRKSQNKKLLMVIGETEGLPKGQVLDPELALTITSNPQATTVQVADFDSSPQHFLDEIRFTLETIIESYGIPQSAVSYDIGKDGGPLALSIKKERLGHLREAQIPYLTRGEQELWPAAVAVCRTAGHPLGRRLPPPDEIRQMLDVQWPRLKVIDDPIQREELYRLQLKRGGTSPIDMLQEDNPHLTVEECEALLQRNIAAWASINEEFAKRNMVMDLSSGLVGSAEAMGKLGPIVRDAAKPTDPTTP